MKAFVFIIVILGDFGVLLAGLINLARYGAAWVKKAETVHLRALLCKNGVLIAAAVVISLVFVLLTQMTAHTPEIVDGEGKKVEGSVSRLQQIEVNGHKEWISIRGENQENPVMLFLAGGPGGTQLAATRYELAGLEEEFIVVNWEQPGSGKSYSCMKREDITVDTYIEDGRAVTEYLCESFDQDKIYLMGESWGSALGLLLAQRYPELYAGVIGTGQMVDFEQTELIDYEQAMQIVKDAGNTKVAKQLEKQGKPLYYEGNIALLSANYLNVLTAEMTANPDISNSGFHTFRDMFAEEYGILDSIHYMLGIMNTFNVVYPQLYETDLRQSCRTLEVPVYFFLGRHDINAPTELACEYFEFLECPEKELVWFEHSGHTPWMNESDKFVRETVRVFLGEQKETQS